MEDEFSTKISRRRLLRGALTAGSGLLAAYVVGCGDGDKDEPSATPETTVIATAKPATPTQPAPTANDVVLHWQQLPASGPVPPPRHDHSLVTDGKSLFLFGGRSSAPLADLWSFDLASGAWTAIATPGPAARFGHNAVYDATVGRMLVFGGQAGEFFNDLWIYDPATAAWSEVVIPGAAVPSRRYGAASALDPVGRLVVSHGFTNSGRFDDTWAYGFAAESWRDLSPTDGPRPVERCLMRGVWDRAGKRFLMFGGQTDGTPFLGDLWALNEGGWAEITSEPKPSPRNFYAMAFDEASRQALLFGGRTADGPLAEVWRFDAATDTWSRASVQEGGPPARYGHDAVWLEQSRKLIAFGGRTDSGDLNDLWELVVV